jgi:hypothetical protein
MIVRVHIDYGTVIVCQRRHKWLWWRWESRYLTPSRLFRIPLWESIPRNVQILHTELTTLKKIECGYVHVSGISVAFDIDLDYKVPDIEQVDHVIDVPLKPLLRRTIEKCVNKELDIAQLPFFIMNDLIDKLRRTFPEELICLGDIKCKSVIISNFNMFNLNQRNQVDKILKLPESQWKKVKETKRISKEENRQDQTREK